MAKRQLDDSEFVRLQGIFKGKKWPIEPTEDGVKDSLFDLFCKMLRELRRDESSLVMELTEDFVNYDLIFNPLFEECVRSFLSSPASAPLESCDAVIVTAILPVGCTSLDVAGHSGSSLVYPARAHLPNFRMFQQKDRLGQLFHRPNPEEVELLLTDPHIHQAFVIFVDDFTGTGSTVWRAMDHWIARFGAVKQVNACALILVAMQEGVHQIHSHGHEVFVARTHRKGLTNSTRCADKIAAFKIMDEIEKRLAVIPNNKYGYGQSEALVKMITTPDNTFPVFWHLEDAHGHSWPAPFKRYQIR